MKVAAATSLLFATLALASPAPIAQPEANAASVAQPIAVEARNAAPVLVERAPKKPKTPSSGNNTDTGAADMITPSRALQLGALGLGVMEVVRLWG
jgi:hypothetical protein